MITSLPSLAARPPTPREMTAKTLVDVSLMDPDEPSKEHTVLHTEQGRARARVPSRAQARSIGGYDVLQKLNDLGTAEVFLAERRAAHGIVRRAVVKRIARWAPDFDQQREILLDEAMVTACFTHPNLTTLVDVGEDDHAAYIALEHVEGTNLFRLNTTLRTRHVALPFELSCFIVAEALRGMHYAHTLRGPDGRELDVVLRDRTPANMLISNNGHVKLCDFSLALTKTRRQNATERGMVKGAYAYLAPEYIAGGPCSVRSDVYALGVMLFELLAGRECFGTDTAYDTLAQIVGRGVVWQELEREGVPAKLMEIVARATNPCPGGRYESAMEMLEALEQQMLSLGRAATSTILARTLAKYELVPRAGSETIDEKKYTPQLRIVRGGSIIVSAPQPQPQPQPPPLPQPQAQQQLQQQPPPLPPISLVPIEEPPEDLSAISDAFGAPSEPDQALNERPEVRGRDVWTESEIAGLFTDSGNEEELELAEEPVKLKHRKRPRIDQERVVVRRSSTEVPWILVVAGLIAIALFAAIITYPT